ncbi:MAG TPA: M48 family metallopeptidase, partial [Acidobacteriaceae bacterium]|nr:M48 family metallopeptidase [Acidobacteriaceae bacterium]
MQLRWGIVAALAVTCVLAGGARVRVTTATEARAERLAAQDLSAYTLPPEKLAKALALDGTERVLHVTGELWTLVQLMLLLALGAVARMRDAAMRLSANRWTQGFAFTFMLLFTVLLLDLPLDLVGHHVALSYGISVQRWWSWLGDRAKAFALMWGIGGLIVMVAAWIVRRSPARWWLGMWLASVVFVLAGVLITPYVIDPMFNTFEPLAKTNPALVEQLEQVVARSGIAIPPERLLLMKASAKSTLLNAYVTGFGPSKRVVVWDTTVAKSSPDEIAFIFAHEVGHYALGHVALGVGLSCLGLLPMFWLGYRGLRLALARYGAAWRIPSQQDWGALVVLAMVLLAVSDVSEPLGNAVSRWMEHNADVYGQEAVHGIVADPQATGVRSFQVLGEDSLDDPTPHRMYEWWFGTHPSIAFRAAFARAYDPWAQGERPK